MAIDNPSRGDSISGYLPGLDGTSGIKIRLNEMKGQRISGACAADGVTYAVAHQLGAVPAMVLISPILTEANVVCDISGGTVGEAAASAATTTHFYVIGNVDGIKYRAFLLL